MKTKMLFPLLALAASLPQIRQFAYEAHGKVGVAVAFSTGESVEFHAADRFPMQSVYKFPIAMAVLHAVDKGSVSLDRDVTVLPEDLVPAALHSPIRDDHPDGGFAMPLRELLRYAVSESDGTASDVLLRLLGGPVRADEYVRSLGVTEVTIATTEKEMARDNQAQYRNWATPRGMVRLLRAFNEGRGLSVAGRAILMRLMTEGPTGANRIKGLLPPGVQVAHKTGTSGTVDGMTAATNDVGIVTGPGGKTMAIAVFVSDSTADTATREATIAKIARAAWGR